MATPAANPAAQQVEATQDAQNARSRWRVSAHETNVLEAVFASSPRPNKNTIVQLASMLGVKPRQVQVWFQNRRQRWRKDFLELERARSQQMAELSGKVIDFHGDLAMAHAASAGTDSAMPAGWERLLMQPNPAAVQPVQAVVPGVNPVAPTPVIEAKPAASAPAPEPVAPAVASPASKPVEAVAAAPVAVQPVAAVAPAPLIAEVNGDEIKSQIDTLDEIDICALLNFPTGSTAPPSGKEAPFSSVPPLVGRSHTELSLNASPPKSPASEDPEDTIWLGMEWLIADSDGLTV